jgi:hypothetical protein
MKNFLAIYIGAQDARSKWDELSNTDREKRKSAGIEAWMDWGRKNPAVIVDQAHRSERRSAPRRRAARTSRTR